MDACDVFAWDYPKSEPPSDAEAADGEEAPEAAEAPAAAEAGEGRPAGPPSEWTQEQILEAVVQEAEKRVLGRLHLQSQNPDVASSSTALAVRAPSAVQAEHLTRKRHLEDLFFSDIL